MSFHLDHYALVGISPFGEEERGVSLYGKRRESPWSGNYAGSGVGARGMHMCLGDCTDAGNKQSQEIYFIMLLTIPGLEGQVPRPLAVEYWVMTGHGGISASVCPEGGLGASLKKNQRNSLVVQPLGLRSFTAEGPGFIPRWRN